MKKILSLFLVFGLFLGVVGCSDDGEENTSNTENPSVEEKDAEPTFGTTFEFDGLEITFGESVEYFTIDNEYSDKNGAEVARVPVTVTNISDELNGVNMFYVTIYGSQGTQLEDITAYFDDDFTWSISSESLRAGATASAYCYFLYDGSGDYYINFDNFSEEIEVKLPISK